jgi:type 2 lantibiotic biosynthesis protein LanM
MGAAYPCTRVRADGIVCGVSLTSSPKHLGVALPPSWWARGLALHERGHSGDQPTEQAVAATRLAQWSETYPVAEVFDERLAAAGLDRSRLRNLLAEPQDTLAARNTRPAWASVIEQVVASAPAAPQPVETGQDGVDSLAPALRPFVDFAVDRLRASAPVTRIADTVDVTAVVDGFAHQLGRSLTRLAARTLVLELNVARTDGRLAGEDTTTRFADFVAGVATGPGLAGLLGEYPVLARILGQACGQAVDAHREILDRFATDRADVVATLLSGVDPGRLTAVDVGSGDRHRGGRSVAVLRFADVSVVYKPRSLAVQEHFHDLIGWLNARVAELGLRAVRSLPRHGYGWQEFVSHRPCVDTSGVELFYRRQGALLALLYALHGTDMHYENLIAVGDQPVLVDVETLFQPALSRPNAAGSDPAAAVLASSVASTALLPVLLVGEHGALDVSGLGGGRQGVLPDDVVTWANPGTDRMRLARGVAGFTGGGNRPVLDDAGVEDEADPHQYTDELLAGFRAGYEAIVGGRAELLVEDGPLARCAGDEIRILVRATRDYATVLDETTHPDVLRDALDRDALLDTLWADAPNELARSLAAHEVADLWLGDIPVFRSTPDSADLRTSGDVVVPDVLARTGLAAVTATVAKLDGVDREVQEWVIRAALATRAPGPWHRTGPALPASVPAVLPDPERLLSSACGIADEIIARALHDDRRVNWLGIEPLDDHRWSVLPMGAGLADGYTGVALFLAQLGALTGVHRYTDMARRAITPIPHLLNAFATDPEQALVAGCGGFSGLGGVSYALARLLTLLGDPQIRDWLALAVTLLGVAGTAEPATPTPDVATGLAGGLAALLAVHAETGLAAAAEHAAGFATALAAAPALPDGGFLHGRDGVDWALARYRADAPVHTAEPAGHPGSDLGWCRGTAGLLLARHDVRPDADTARQVDRFVAMLGDRRPLRDMSPCHGELGVLELLTEAATTHSGAAVARERGTAFLLGELDHLGAHGGTPDGVSCPGLLTGLAGIGYGLLRLGFATRVPSVLLLRPSPGGTPGSVPSQSRPQ